MKSGRRWILLVVVMAACGCQGQRENSEPLNAAGRTAVEESVKGFMSQVAQDVTREGPVAWGKEFSTSADFFMASDGNLMFPSGEEAQKALPAVSQLIKKIELQWGNLRIDVLAPNLAVVGTSWQEVRTDPQGRMTQDSGYFTGVVEHKNGKWEFRDAHWSSAPPAAKAP
jgi:hypothetical protein